MTTHIIESNQSLTAIGKSFGGKLVRRPCFAVIMSVVISLTVWGLPMASAQQANSFEQLQVLVKPGDKVDVTGTDGTITKGKIESLTPSALRIATKTGIRDFSQKDALMIQQKRGDSLGNGAVIGAVSGAGFAGLALVAICSSEGCDGEGGFVAGSIALYTGLGAGIGVGIDALISHRHTIYKQPAQSMLRSIRVSPVISNTRKGAAMRFSF